MKTKKRTKNSRIRGSRTVGWGFRQKHKGHGNRGGYGLAGSGKRGDHKKQKALELGGGKYFGHGGFTSKSTVRKKNNVLNLDDIKKNMNGAKIVLAGFKILGKGDGFKAEIIAGSASKTAISKMEKAGGKITLPEKKIRKKEKKITKIKK